MGTLAEQSGVADVRFDALSEDQYMQMIADGAAVDTWKHLLKDGHSLCVSFERELYTHP